MLGWTVRTMVLAASLMSLAGPANAEPRDPSSAMADAVGAALQGDAARARAILLTVRPESFDAKDRRSRDCIVERFTPGAKPTLAPDRVDGIAQQALEAYRAYWQRALLNVDEADAAEAALRRELQSLLGEPGHPTLDTLSADLEARLKRDGWWSLQGRTGKLREFMLWRHQEERRYDVSLPEGRFGTDVELLSDFASLGWGDYATCGRRGAGGWATTDKLYAVVPRYASLEGEEFQVTFLAHETQHFVDKRRWPDLASWRLEYRAKLVELSQVNATRSRVLTKFLEDRNDDPESPHSYANQRLVRDLSARLRISTPAQLFDVPIAKLNAAAAAQLAEDTRQLASANGA